jgi:hypothetical protein
MSTRHPLTIVFVPALRYKETSNSKPHISAESPPGAGSGGPKGRGEFLELPG